ncbi:MAG: dihydroorotate dehydrogenase electron transfer subunit [Candidatus Atribacteria bacterium]|nr:dihydroorotate dehydrogenase electron transfer subunit [Candidatus Atribacteria bacterium]
MKQTPVTAIKTRGGSFVELELAGKEIARVSRPGQFVMIGAGQSYDPFLKRPLGILSVQEDRFSLLFQIVGQGTKLLSQLQPGNTVSVLGPLGNGFSLHPSEAVLIAGGRGIVPLVFLASHFQQAGIPFTFFWGVKNELELVLASYLASFSPSCVLSCEEAVSGYGCGTVLTSFSSWEKTHPLRSGSRVYACGPQGMFRVMQKIPFFSGVPVEVSLEARMGCGFGVCLGCAVKKKEGSGYVHVCKDGPVFLLPEVEL